VALELRPAWCLDDSVVEEILEIGAWVTKDGRPALGRDGDDWKPGEPVGISRVIRLKDAPADARRRLGLRPGAVVGVACRWTCRTTSEGGTHVGGPAPLPLADNLTLSLEIPSNIAGSIELETCLLVRWTTDDRSPNSCPDGAMIWSEGWNINRSERTLLLEGSEVRIPVRTVAFANHYGQSSGALWAIDLDPSVALDDILSNVVTVLINREVLDRDFRNADGEGDASLIPAHAAAGIQVDLLRSLTAALKEELDGDEDWHEQEEGTIGAVVVRHLTETFDSVEAGLADFSEDQPAFSRRLWDRFAPSFWGA
jgi:hypothetical protein